MLALSAPAEAQPAGFSLVTVAAGLDQPTAFAFKGVKILVTEKASGKVQVVLADGSLRPTPYVTLSVSSQSERGVLGIAVDPDFATNKFVYVYYTTGPGALGYTGSPKNRVSRFTTGPGLVGTERDHHPRQHSVRRRQSQRGRHPVRLRRHAVRRGRRRRRSSTPTP